MGRKRSSMRVALVQWAASLDPAANLERLDELDDIARDADLVVLPEAFARDFGDPGGDLSAYAEPLDGPFADKLADLARRHGTTVVAGMFETSPDPGRPFNALVVAAPERRSPYRKIHLYDSFGHRESDRVSPGKPDPMTVEVNGLSVGLMTCYDLRFPELARALVSQGAEVLVVPAAWVAGPYKVDHWRTLLRARAIENIAYVIGVGQPGPRYCGHSAAISPVGELLIEAGESPDLISVELPLDAVRRAREANPSLANRRM
ncbi:MAG: carbon-nitrogen hydrolase family protein [Actinomycetota bacterium]|nr:carbon-nitrogen hydrolase family protein [Actinomycetota bacterium]